MNNIYRSLLCLFTVINTSLAVDLPWDTNLYDAVVVPKGRSAILFGGNGGSTNAALIKTGFVPTNYSAFTSDMESHLRGIDSKFGTTTNARSIKTGFQSYYYSTTNNDIESHLSGIDTAIGSKITITQPEIDAINNDRLLQGMRLATLESDSTLNANGKIIDVYTDISGINTNTSTNLLYFSKYIANVGCANPYSDGWSNLVLQFDYQEPIRNLVGPTHPYAPAGSHLPKSYYDNDIGAYCSDYSVYYGSYATMNNTAWAIGATQITFATWIKVKTLSTTTMGQIVYQLSARGGYPTQGGLAINQNSLDGRVGFENSYSFSWQNTVPNLFDQNKWTHIAIVQAWTNIGGTSYSYVKTYKNGTLFHTKDGFNNGAAGSITSDNSLWQWGLSKSFEFVLANTVAFTRILSNNEIFNLYGLTAPTNCTLISTNYPTPNYKDITAFISAKPLTNTISPNTNLLLNVSDDSGFTWNPMNLSYYETYQDGSILYKGLVTLPTVSRSNFTYKIDMTTNYGINFYGSSFLFK